MGCIMCKRVCKSGVETDRGSNDDREANGVMVPTGLTTSIRHERWREQGGELLPGISDDITLKHISTKLSWKDVHVLSSVSPGWQQALQSREIYDNRIDSYSKETLFVIPHINPGKHGSQLNVSFSLYSFQDKYAYELPPFPFGTYWTVAPTFLSLDRNIYVLGGSTHQPTGNRLDATIEEPKSNVYMLDLVEKQWKQCASMSQPRNHQFAAAALNGKIYVFGNSGDTVSYPANFLCPISLCEVYDPKIDAWSLIKPMPSWRLYHRVATMGDELFVYDGVFCPGSILDPCKFAPFLDIYHPVKDEWRRILPFEGCRWNMVFTARGNFHRMTPPGIEVYDIENESWSLQHTFHDTRDGHFIKTKIKLIPHCALALDDELLIEEWRKCRGRWKRSLFQSKGFGSKNKAIRLEKVHNYPRSLSDWFFIQL